MFSRKKGGAPGEKHDVVKAVGEMDADTLKQVGGQAAEAGKKEGKKKMGYMKRMVKDKFDEQTKGKAVLSEAETQRRETGAEPVLAVLKRQKEHSVATLSAMERQLACGGPAAATIQELANACPNQARTLVTQVCGAVVGLNQLYVMSINSNVLLPVEEARGSIDAAREAKETYYELRQAHDRTLANFQNLQSKTDAVKPEKLEKHQQAIADSKGKWEQATADYNSSEASLFNACAIATHKKGEVDVLVMKAVVEAELTEQAGIEESFAPVADEIAKARAAAQAYADDCADKMAKLCDPGAYPKVALADASVDNALTAAAEDEAQAVLSPTTPTPDDEDENPAALDDIDVAGAAAGGIAAAAAVPAGGSTMQVTIQKGPKGFGFSTDEEGVITGAGGAAADAGVPAGSKIVAVGGVAVGGKADIIGQLRALGPEVTEVEFTLLLSSAYGSAGAPDGNVAI